MAAAVLAAITVWLPGMFLTPEVASSLLMLAPILILHGFTTPIIAMLERRFLFGVHFIIGVSSTFLSVALAIVLALNGFGYMSLVWGTVAEYTIRFTLALCCVRKTRLGARKAGRLAQCRTVWHRYDGAERAADHRAVNAEDYRRVDAGA